MDLLEGKKLTVSCQQRGNEPNEKKESIDEIPLNHEDKPSGMFEMIEVAKSRTKSQAECPQ